MYTAHIIFVPFVYFHKLCMCLMLFTYSNPLSRSLPRSLVFLLLDILCPLFICADTYTKTGTLKVQLSQTWRWYTCAIFLHPKYSCFRCIPFAWIVLFVSPSACGSTLMCCFSTCNTQMQFEEEHVHFCHALLLLESFRMRLNCHPH